MKNVSFEFGKWFVRVKFTEEFWDKHIGKRWAIWLERFLAHHYTKQYRKKM